MSSREDRRRARRSLPGHLTTLERQATVQRIPPEEALAMMWELAQTAWLFSGRELPSYERARAPGRVIRPEIA